MVFRPIVIIVFAGMGTAFAQRALMNAGSCLTPQNTLCRTIIWARSGWENTNWGIHAVRRWSGRTILAYRRDGATFNRSSFRQWHNYFVPEGDWDSAEIKIPSLQTSIEIDYKAREYTQKAGVRGGFSVWDADDKDCAKLARAFDLSDLRRVQGETLIAGINSIQYTGLRTKTQRYSVWLAPSVGCTQMRVEISDHNVVGLPTLHSVNEVVSLKLGDPEEGLFEVPAGYKQTR